MQNRVINHGRKESLVQSIVLNVAHTTINMLLDWYLELQKFHHHYDSLKLKVTYRVYIPVIVFYLYAMYQKTNNTKPSTYDRNIIWFKNLP